MVNLTVFLSSFNNTLKARQRMLRVQKTTALMPFIIYLYELGYILGYHVHNGFITVYPNYNIVLYKKFHISSSPSRPIFHSANYVFKEYRRGINYFYYLDGQFFDSKTAILYKSGGFALGYIY